MEISPSSKAERIHHRSGHQSNTPLNNFGPQSFYIILYPTCDGTFRIPGVTNPVESTLGSSLESLGRESKVMNGMNMCDDDGIQL